VICLCRGQPRDWKDQSTDSTKLSRTYGGEVRKCHSLFAALSTKTITDNGHSSQPHAQPSARTTLFAITERGELMVNRSISIVRTIPATLERQRPIPLFLAPRLRGRRAEPPGIWHGRQVVPSSESDAPPYLYCSNPVRFPCTVSGSPCCRTFWKFACIPERQAFALELSWKWAWQDYLTLAFLASTWTGL